MAEQMSERSDSEVGRLAKKTLGLFMLMMRVAAAFFLADTLQNMCSPSSPLLFRGEGSLVFSYYAVACLFVGFVSTMLYLIDRHKDKNH